MREQIEKAITKLVEQEYKYQKPFPATGRAVVGGAGTIPGRLASRALPWRVELSAEDAPVPWEMFAVQDLHKSRLSQPRPQGFIGWIGGTYSDSIKNDQGQITSAGTVFVDEVQSDLLQRTIEFVDPVKYQQGITKQFGSATVEYGKAFQELQALKKEYAQSKGLWPLNKRLGYEEKMGELEDLLKQLADKRKREPKHPEYAQFKSKLENFYKKWVNALFNAALDFAKEKDVYFLAVIPASKVKEIWSMGSREHGGILFDRIYDATAQRWGMTLRDIPGLGKWWVRKLAELTPLESLREQLRLDEQVAMATWKPHLEAFLRYMTQREEYSLRDPDDFHKMFLLWLNSLPDELIQQQEFKQEVEQYVQQKYGHDVFTWWITSKEASQENLGQWLIHLDAFARTFARTQSLNLRTPEGFKEVFEFWLEEVPGYVKYVKKSQQRIAQYVKQKWGVDISNWWTVSPEADVDWSNWDVPESQQDIERAIDRVIEKENR